MYAILYMCVCVMYVCYTVGVCVMYVCVCAYIHLHHETGYHKIK